MRALAVVGLAGLLMALGCEDKKPEPAAAAAATTTAAAAATTTAPSAAKTADAVTGSVATEEDFEEKAEASITPANAKEEVAKLEKEIGQ